MEFIVQLYHRLLEHSKFCPESGPNPTIRYIICFVGLILCVPASYVLLQCEGFYVFHSARLRPTLFR